MTKYLKKLFVFCDESGNTGHNYLDKNSPFYVLAGWLLESKEVSKLESDIESFRNRHYPQAKELKGSALLKRRSGEKNSINLIREAGKLATPMFIVSEKRYMLSAKIIETFLDPVTNKKMNFNFTWRNDIKIIYANKIYDYAPQSVELFGRVYKNPIKEELEKFLKQLIEELNSNEQNDLANLLSGSFDYMAKISKSELYLKSLPNNTMRGPNVPVFASFLQLLDKKLNYTKHTISIVHDSTREYKDMYPEVFRNYTRKKDDVTLTLGNGREHSLYLKNLKQFEFIESDLSVLIQTADVLAAVINKFFTSKHNNKKLNKELKYFGKVIAASIFLSNMQGITDNDVIISKSMKEKILNIE